MTIRRIFVKFPYINNLIELNNNSNYIFNDPCYEWIIKNKIEDYIFIDVIHEGIKYKLPVSDFKFMY